MRELESRGQFIDINRLTIERADQMFREGLTSGQASALKLTYGLADGRVRTQEEVAEELGVTPRGAKRMVTTAIRRLRAMIPRVDQQ